MGVDGEEEARRAALFAGLGLPEEKAAEAAASAKFGRALEGIVREAGAEAGCSKAQVPRPTRPAAPLRPPSAPYCPVLLAHDAALRRPVACRNPEHGDPGASAMMKAYNHTFSLKAQTHDGVLNI